MSILMHNSREKAMSVEAIRNYLRWQDEVVRRNSLVRLSCDIAVPRGDDYATCTNTAVAIAVHDYEGEWLIADVCSFHANRAGKGNVIPLDTILAATRA